MISLIFAFIAAANAVAFEVISRKASISQIWWLIPISSIVTTSLVYYLQHGSKSYLTALVWFSLFTLIFRLTAAHFIVHEPMSKGNILAAGALSFAAIAKIFVR